MKNLKIYSAILILILISSYSNAQQVMKPYPVTGQPCPDFNFTEVTNYGKKSISLNEMKGKYFILDFWSKSCATCVASMPKVNRIQEEFKDKVQIIFSGHDDKEGDMRKIYSRLKEKYKLIVPCAYDTVVIFQFVPDHAVPLLVWVDSAGIVKAVTSSDDLNHSNLDKFIKGEPFDYLDGSYMATVNSYKELKEQKQRMLSIDEKDKMDLLFRSTLLKCTNYKGAVEEPNELNEGGIQDNLIRLNIIKMPAKTLYKLAYFGTGSVKSSQIVMEVKDSTDLYDPSQSDVINYSYSLQAPIDRANKEDLMRIMQNDLNSYFGFEAGFEDRTKPCYYLKVVNEDKANGLLSHQDGQTVGNWGRKIGGRVENSSMENFCNLLRLDLPANMILIDQTGIKGKINIEFKNASLVNVEGMRKALEKNGLDLVPGSTVISVLVIKDRKRIADRAAKN